MTTTSSPRRRQIQAYTEASRSMPGGVNANYRGREESTIYVDRGKGGHIWDLDGNEFIDLRLGWGPVILGHADERVDEHVLQRIREGVTFALTTEDEIRASRLMTEMTYCDLVRLTVSGTDATMHAIRLARAYTGRDKIVKFEGQYHGGHDGVLFSVTPNDVAELGSRDYPTPVPVGLGIPEVLNQLVLPVPYNDLDILRSVFEREGDRIAAVIVEPVLGNAQGIGPLPGFLEGLRSVTAEFGSLLIFDEVKTGFRFAAGGAAEYYGVTPDLSTYGKALGNGYPVAAYGGREEVMAMLPEKVSQGGTYAGNRIAAAAAVATLEILRDTDTLERIAAVGSRIQTGLAEAMNRRGIPFVFTGHFTMFGIVFAERMPVEYRDWASSDHQLYDAMAQEMTHRGAMPEPDSREPWFLCVAHEGQDEARIVEIADEALESALAARSRGDVDSLRQ